MKKRTMLRLLIKCIYFTTGLYMLQGCAKQEAAQLFPPIVFKPVFGEINGGPINDNLTVTAVEKLTGQPVAGARVFVHAMDSMELLADGTTGSDGVASFADKAIIGPVSVTITCNETIAYDTVSFIGINAAHVVVPLDRRKSPEQVKTALTFVGLDSGDTKLSVNKNDFSLPEKEVEAGKLEEDPWVLTLDNQPAAFSAFAMDAGGNTTKYGFTVEPDGLIPAATPAMIDLVRVTADNVKTCRGKIENPPANLETPSDGWDPFTRYIFQVYSNGGLAGDVVAGFANLDNAYNYQAFIVQTPVLTKQRFEVLAFNRRDAWSEMTTAFHYFTFETAPETLDISFIDVPKNMQIEKLVEHPLPKLIWISSEGNFKQVEIYHADYNYRWTLYLAGETTDHVILPPIEPGSEGSLIIGEIYRFRVITWQIPGFDFNSMSFQQMADSVTHRARSSMTQFMVTASEKE